MSGDTVRIAIIYYSVRGRLATIAHVIAEGARTVPGAAVSVFRIRDPVVGDDVEKFDPAVLAAPVATLETLLEHDCIVLGAPGRQGGFAGEVRLFLDSLAPLLHQDADGYRSKLMGKVGAAFTSIGGVGRGVGGHEVILQQLHATFLQHGMVVVGVPPQLAMCTAQCASPYGVVVGGLQRCQAGRVELRPDEVKLAYSQGQWAAQIACQVHGPHNRSIKPLASIAEHQETT